MQKRFKIGCLALLLAACGTSNESGMDAAVDMAADQQDTADLADAVQLGPSQPLVVKEGWVEVARAQDPLNAEVSDDPGCSDAGLTVEPGGFEVNTDDCGYATVAAPLLVEIAPGDEVSFIVTHSALIADEPAKAHVAFWLGTEVVTRASKPIPSPSGFFELSWTSTVSLPAGTDLGLHVRNHGKNAYVVTAVSVRKQL